jgi:hypothetical protein
MVMPSLKARRMAIVGLGSIGRRHLRVLKTIRPEIEVVLVRSGKGGDWPEEDLASFDVRTAADAVSIGVDAAIIASPAPFHVEQAKTMVKSGIPVLIEKPLSDRKAGVDELAALAKKNDVKALIGYVLRYSKSFQNFLAKVKSGQVGDPLFVHVECGSYLPDWRPEQDYRKTASAKTELGGGVLLELSHELDYANTLFGPLECVNAIVKNTGSLGVDVEDFAHMVFLSKSLGCPVMVSIDFCRRDAVRTCSIHGTQGTLCWDGINDKVTWQSASGAVEIETFFIERDEMFCHQIKHFLECIESEEKPRVTIDDAAEVLDLIEAAKRANIGNRAVGL